MMKTRVVVLLFASFGVLLPAAAGQIVPSDEPPLTPEQAAAARQAFLSSRNLQLDLTLDRSVYLAGEGAHAVLGAFNPTQEPLAVFDPFDRHSLCLDVNVWFEGADPGSEWRLTDPEGGCGGHAVAATMITLGPGQRIERTIPSAQPPLALPSPPSSAGRYRMSFCALATLTACAHAEFTVVEPVFRGSAAVMLAEPNRRTNPGTGREEQYPRYIHSFILEYGGKRYVGVGQKAVSQPELLVNLDQPLSNGNAVELRVFDRVAEAAMDAHGLQITADAQENLTITWTENDQPKSYCVSADRSIIEPCGSVPAAPVEISISPATTALTARQSQQFSAAVANSSNTAVTWSVALGPNAPAGAQAGTVDTTGLYTAPHAISSQYTVIVTAQSAANPAKSASAGITLNPSEIISTPATPTGPASGETGTTYTYTTGGATSSAGHALQYRFDWGGGGDSGWLPVGTTSAVINRGVANTYAIAAQARCASDTSAVSEMSSPLMVTIAEAVDVHITPFSATLPGGGVQQFSATVTGSTNTAVDWSIGFGAGARSTSEPGTVSVSGLYTAPSTIPNQYMVVVIATSQADPTKRTMAAITLTPRP
jgi:hypothetical protein